MLLKVVKNYSLEQDIVDKFLKLINIGISMERFTPNILLICSITAKFVFMVVGPMLSHQFQVSQGFI